MNTPSSVIEPPREVPVIGAWDVVVCGGGPAGFVAAVAAARNGARTILVESHGFLGGMATAALVGPMSKFNSGGARIVGGIPREFIDRMAESGGAVTDLPSGNVPFDPEVYKYVALCMAREAGVRLRFHTKVVNCLGETGRAGVVSHVIVESPSGREAVGARYVLDCTGTGEVVAKAGLPWRMRTDEEGRLQPMSLVFRLGGVDTDRLTVWMDRDGVKYANGVLQQALRRAVEEGSLEQFGGPWTVFGSTIRRGEVSVNATRYPGNAVDAESRTEAEIRMREDVMKMVDIFRRNCPQFAGCYLIDTAVQAGIRETRAIEGLYTMTADDILNPKDFPDTIAKGAHWIDVHRAEDSTQSATFVRAPYNIPYRAIVPRGSKNVLASGGTVSATKEAFASVRVQAQCMALGQAAGTAAALCARDGLAVDALDGVALRRVLHGQGAIVN